MKLLQANCIFIKIKKLFLYYLKVKFTTFNPTNTKVDVRFQCALYVLSSATQNIIITGLKQLLSFSFKSKRYRDKLRIEVKELETWLPVGHHSLRRKLDSQTIYRLAIAYFRTKAILKRILLLNQSISVFNFTK